MPTVSENGLLVIGDEVYQVLNNFDGTIDLIPTPETERKSLVDEEMK